VASFTDLEGETWAIRVTFADVRAVKDELGFDLPAMFDNGFAGLARLGTDFELLVSVVFALCKRQAEERKIGPDAFAARMGGDTLEAAADAVVDAVTDFFPGQKARETIRSVTNRLKRTSASVMERLPSQLLGELDSVLGKLEENPLLIWSKDSASSLPESSA
jgi:uncharacterized FAD-dependent dehydrogenase